MRKLSVWFLAALLSITLVPVSLKASPASPPVAAPAAEAANSAKATILLNRVHEIHAMDKSNLTASEKKGLRKEVRSAKKQLKEMGGGVYLSVGAIIIIILLLILLL